MEGNIFDSPTEFSIIHCVSADFKMGKGIAKDISSKYIDITDKLLLDKIDIGHTITIQHGDRILLHLISKNIFYNKPTYSSI